MDSQTSLGEVKSLIKIDTLRDDDEGVFFAKSDDIGLAVEAGTISALSLEVKAAIPVLVKLS
jgi:Domain of unknown function (DUF1902)